MNKTNESQPQIRSNTVKTTLVFKIQMMFCLLLHFSIGHVWAQSYLNRSEWIRSAPREDESYFYFRGEGTDRSPERAKAKARLDAIRKVQMQLSLGTTGPLVDVLKDSASDEAFMTKSGVAFSEARFQGLEWVDDYSEYAPEDGVLVNKSFVLVRLPKPKPGLISEFGSAVGGRVDAVFHSAIYPGWGQFRQGRDGSGAFYMITGSLAGLSAISLFVLENEDVQIGGKTPHWETYRLGATYAFLGIYAVNVVDALIFGHEPKKFARIQLSPTALVVRF